MKSITIPFSIKYGRVATTSDPRIATESKIVTTLTTSAGERTGIPNFGANIMSLLFEPLGNMEVADFKVDAMQELTSRVSSVEIMNMRIQPDTNAAENTATVQIIYRLPLSNPQVLSFKVVVPTNLTEETIF